MRAGGKLLGRSTSLWVALALALINASVVLGILRLDAGQIAGLNTLAIALIGVLANEENPTTAGTFAATVQAPSVTIDKPTL